MGKRLSISQPAVIATELTPLVDNFELVANGDTEQWYYTNEGVYAPNRQVTPLIITPQITAVDLETNISYTPSFYSLVWKERHYNGSAWVESVITNTTDTSGYDYVKIGDTLKINKNHSDPQHGIIITCLATYIDPRDAAITYTIPEKTITLTTNEDATRIYPIIDVLSEPTTMYNPLGNTSNLFTFTATMDWTDVPLPAGASSNRGYYVWYGVDSNGDEVLINTLPFYVSGQNTATLVVNALYGEEINIILRLKTYSTDADVLPVKVYRSVIWRIPTIDPIVVCNNGGAVRSENANVYSFRTIVNVKGKTLSDEAIAQHLRFNWFSRKAEAGQNEVNRGWGKELYLQASDLMNVASGNVQERLSSTLVRSEVYILGAYQKVSHESTNVTYNGQQVYSRTI